MTTKLLMAASAIVMGVFGAAATFAPHELLRAVAAPEHYALPLAVQLLGALYFGFAMLNWMAKDSAIGGIYNRPVLIGNLVHFLIGALALGKGLLRGPLPGAGIALTAVYALFAIAFGTLMFRSPKRAD